MIFTPFNPPRYITLNSKDIFFDIYERHAFLKEICSVCHRRKGYHYCGNCNNIDGINTYPIDFRQITVPHNIKIL